MPRLFRWISRSAVLAMACGLATALLAAAPAMASAGFLLAPVAGQDYVASEGSYSGHLQGISTNGVDAIYWSYTDKLIKTDTAGKIVKSVNVLNHHGDLTYANGKLYVAVNDLVTSPPGEFNVANPANPARQWVYEYDAGTLVETAKYRVPEAIYGAGGIAYHEGRFLVVGGLPTDQTQNTVLEYDSSFNLIEAHQLPTGYTFRGMQTAEFAHGHWWFGTYHSLNGSSSNRQLFKFSETLDSFTQYSFDASLGIAALPDGHFLIGKNENSGAGYVGRVHLASLHAAKGLEIVPIPVPEPQGFVLVMIGLAAAGGFGLLAFRRRWSHAVRMPFACRADPTRVKRSTQDPSFHR